MDDETKREAGKIVDDLQKYSRPRDPKSNQSSLLVNQVEAALVLAGVTLLGIHLSDEFDGVEKITLTAKLMLAMKPHKSAESDAAALVARLAKFNMLLVERNAKG